MIGNTIKYKDRNNNIIKGRVVDKIKCITRDNDHRAQIIDCYLVVNADTTVNRVNPSRIKNIL